MAKQQTKVHRLKPVKTATGQRAYDKAIEVQELLVDSIENIKRMHKIGNREIAEELGLTHAAINSRLRPDKKTGIAEILECLYVVEQLAKLDFTYPEFCEPQPSILQAAYY